MVTLQSLVHTVEGKGGDQKIGQESGISLDLGVRGMASENRKEPLPGLGAEGWELGAGDSVKSCLYVVASVMTT